MKIWSHEFVNKLTVTVIIVQLWTITTDCSMNYVMTCHYDVRSFNEREKSNKRWLFPCPSFSRSRNYFKENIIIITTE